MTNAFKILVGKPEEKRPLGRHRCRMEDSIKIYLGESENWIHLAHNRQQWRIPVDRVMNLTTGM
jgi:hypothetical protein